MQDKAKRIQTLKELIRVKFLERILIVKNGGNFIEKRH